MTMGWRASAQATGASLSAAERSALKVFRDFRVGRGEMFCFTGPLLAKHHSSLGSLIEKELVVKEQFMSGYSLTPAGSRALARTLDSRS